MNSQLAMDLFASETSTAAAAEMRVEGQSVRILGAAELSLAAGKTIAIDCETTGLNWMEDKVIGLGIWCPQAELCGYLPEDQIENARKIMLGWPSNTKVLAHNLKFDFHMLGINPRLPNGRLRFKIFDTTIMIHLYDSRMRKKLDLAEAAFLGTDSKQLYLNQIPPKSRKDMAGWPISILTAYCTNDARVCYALAQHLMPELKQLGLIDLLVEQMEYMGLVWEVERRGMPVNVPLLMDIQKQLAEEVMLLEKALKAAVKMPNLHWKSNAELAHALYDVYGWERPKNPFADADGVDRTRFADKGKYNKTMTSGFLLAEKAQHPLAPIVLTLRETDKLHQLAVKYSEICGSDGCIHPSYNMTGTRTGRLSCSDPNLQNIPGEWRSRAGTMAFEHLIGSGEQTEDEQVKKLTHREQRYNLRLAFSVPAGEKMLSIDYRQMEMRMFGVLAQEPFMIESLAAGRDIHSEICKKVWGEVTEMRREWSKLITFGLIYGMTMGSLQFKLNMSQDEANKLATDYWNTFPRIKPWLNSVIRTCKRNGYLRYWSGRIWREDKQNDMYKGANALIQGGCADLLSISALRCDELLRKFGSGQIINFVHDELLYRVPTEALPELIPMLQKEMQVPDLLDMPFLNEAKVGDSYGNIEKWSYESGSGDGDWNNREDDDEEDYAEEESSTGNADIDG